MEIRVKRSDFHTDLALMQGIVERRSTIPILSHLLLTVRDDQLHLAATDLDVSLTAWCTGEARREGGIAVDARKFKDIIFALPSDDIEIELEEPQTLKIVAGQSRFKIRGLPPEDFPTLPRVAEDGRIELPFRDFRRMVAKVLFAVSAEESRFQLNGALLRLKKGAIEMVATDGHRLALVENQLDGAADEDPVLVPRKALQELQRFEGEEEAIGYRRGENHLSFRLGRRELICRILEGTFPDYERVIAKDNDKRVVLDRKGFVDAVQRVALLTAERARAVRLSFGSDRLAITAQNPDLGEAHEELSCEYGGEDFTLGINPDYLKDFLSAAETDKIRLDLKDQDSQAVGYPVEGADSRYLCVIMPMRV